MLPRYLSIDSLLLELFMLFKVASGTLLSKSGITFAFQMINALYLWSWWYIITDICKFLMNKLKLLSAGLFIPVFGFLLLGFVRDFHTVSSSWNLKQSIFRLSPLCFLLNFTELPWSYLLEVVGFLFSIFAGRVFKGLAFLNMISYLFRAFV